MNARAAIVGVDVLTGLGGLRETWEAVARERCGLAPIDRFDATPFGSPPACLLADDGTDAEDDPAERILGPHGRVFERCARAAHARARGAEVPREEVGLYAATGMVDAAPEDLRSAVLASRGPEGDLDLARFFATGFRAIHPLWPLSMLNNVGLGQIATGLDIRGDNQVLASEADAGVRAFAEALAALRGGIVRLALVGGVAERVGAASLARRRLRGLTLPPGEGGAVVALEHPDSARQRGVEVLAWLSGAAVAFGDGARERAEAEALRQAGDGPEVRRWPGAAGFVGDLGAAAPAVEVAWIATFFARWLLPAGRRAPRALVVGESSLGGVGALVLERAEGRAP